MSLYGGRPIQFAKLPPFAVEHTVAVRYTDGTEVPSQFPMSYDPLQFQQTPFSTIAANWGKNYLMATKVPEAEERVRVRREKRAEDQLRRFKRRAEDNGKQGRYHPYH